jgi:hypothetical protein
MHQRDQHCQHRDDIEQERQALTGADRDRIHRRGRDRRRIGIVPDGGFVPFFRHHQFADQDRGRRAEH